MTITISIPFTLPRTLVLAARVMFPVVMPLALTMIGSTEPGSGLRVGLEIGLVLLRHLLGA
ncbi:hypothetical protein JOL79_20265 [Microbispora sp. RL4-1S]|uniref:Uncharacterized protein n=1 Tax=Microbispora oryzae TaxID=2806554 RepID=A0A940WJK1_9ACTN|nr:hypothetical protein [Microbispora oryzae]MBP2706148.1 hypothetical protein [Microbispora oryzae]